VWGGDSRFGKAAPHSGDIMLEAKWSQDQIAGSSRQQISDNSKPIAFSGHASQQMQFRGATEGEVADTIRTTPWHPAENGRMECRKDFLFEAVWNGRHYATKQVRPVFVEEPNEIGVVTVYVYYF
jgi:hypothetical protein